MRPAALALLALLTGCHEQIEGFKADDRICTTPPTVRPGDYRACVHKWAYRLAKSPDPGVIVAKAAISACEDAFWFDANAQTKDPVERDQITARSMGWMENNSLFWVVQARAGKCAIP